MVAVIVGMLLLFDFMSCWSAASTPTGGVRWPSVSFLACSSWWKLEEMRGSVDNSYNKPGCSVPVLQIGPLLSLCAGDHRGGGDAVKRRWRSLEGRFVVSSSSPVSGERRWRLLMFLPSPGHGIGGGWPTSLLLPVNPLAEWQPYDFLPAMKPKRRQFCAYMVAKAFGHGSFAAPSGHVPRRRRGVNCASAEDPIAFLDPCWRSFMQSLGVFPSFLWVCL